MKMTYENDSYLLLWRRYYMINSNGISSTKYATLTMLLGYLHNPARTTHAKWHNNCYQKYASYHGNSYYVHNIVTNGMSVHW